MSSIATTTRGIVFGSILMNPEAGFKGLASRSLRRGLFHFVTIALVLLLLEGPRLQGGEVKDVLASIGQVLAGDDDATGGAQIRLEGSGVVVSPEGIVV